MLLAADGMEIFVRPEDVTLVYWDYYHTDYDHYVSMIESHKLLTDKITFAGGAWKWVGFAPINAYSNLTAESAVPACRARAMYGGVAVSLSPNTYSTGTRIPARQGVRSSLTIFL